MFGLNIMEVRQYEYHEWWYSRTFDAPEDVCGKRVACVSHIDIAPKNGACDVCAYDGGHEHEYADEWSTDIGVGCKYFSQDAVIKLAPRAGIELDPDLTPAEKLKAVQELMEQDDPRAQAVFETIGIYLAYTVVLYSKFYDIHHMMVLGRVMSGKGGETILNNCQLVLKDEFPALYEKIQVMLPDEKTRRVGQSVAAASLPEIRK